MQYREREKKGIFYSKVLDTIVGCFYTNVIRIL